MIAHIHGEVAEKFASSVTVDVGGVGYEVQVATGEYDALTLGDTVKLYTYHHIREQAEELFGFSTLAGKKLFELLIAVQGVGPKAALAILSIGDTEEVRNAIANNDTTYVAKASGVGKKSAERVVLDLRDKVGLPLRMNNDVFGEARLAHAGDEALEALMALGYSLGDASAKLEGVSTDLSTSERVTEALKR